MQANNLIEFAMSYGIESLIVSKSVKLSVEYRTRYLSTNDSFKNEHDAFVANIFDYTQIRQFSDDETFALSRAADDYDILIIGGSDPLRMGRFLRANRFLLNNIATIAVLHGSTPPRRARLLNVGFDDVIDSARMPVDEAMARIAAITQRYAVTRQVHHSMHEKKAGIAHLCNPTELTPRELALLAALSRNAGQAVAVSQLCRVIDPADPAKFKRSIKVSMSNLRRKLTPGYRIQTNFQGAYGLYHSADQTVDS